MEKVPLSDIFNIQYGHSLDLTVLELCSVADKDGINYVSRTRENNGVSARVRIVEEYKPFDAGLITVAASGNSVLETSIQLQPFYTGFHVFVLTPKKEMSELEKLFYCHCIRKNRYRYSFGRQANKTLKSITVPSQIPEEFKTIQINQVSNISSDSVATQKTDLNLNEWRYFDLKKLFNITGSKTTPLLVLEELGSGCYPYVTTQATNNGVQGFYNYFTETGNVLTIDSAVLGYCSYQPMNFSASDHVEKLIPMFEMNEYRAMFFITILNLEQYRYNYGRKASHDRLRKIKIKLPAKNGKPDFEYMDKFIKSLPYSVSLENIKNQNIQKT